MADRVPEMGQSRASIPDLVNLAVGKEMNVRIQDWTRYADGHADDIQVVNEVIEETFSRLGIEYSHHLKQLCAVIGRASLRRAFMGTKIWVSDGDRMHPGDTTYIELRPDTPRLFEAEVQAHETS